MELKGVGDWARLKARGKWGGTRTWARERREACGGGLVGCSIYYSHQKLRNIINFGVENGFYWVYDIINNAKINENQEIGKSVLHKRLGWK